MADTASIWPERLLLGDVAGPLEILEREANKLRASRPDLQVVVTTPRRGENAPDGSQTSRIDLQVNHVAFATIEYPDRLYPALLVTGQAPHWRYHRIFEPEGLTSTLKTELLEDDRMRAFF